MLTQYPGSVDTDASLPAVYDGVTEVNTSVFNSMRDAIVSIQRAIGVNPQGETSSLVQRLSASLNDDGTLKASALLAAGLIALPIVNGQISASAAIEESKLDLDFATQNLQNQITSNDVDIANLQQAASSILNQFTQHWTGNSYKHDSFDILLDKSSPASVPVNFEFLDSVNVGDAVLKLIDILTDHTDADKVGAHAASNISVDASGFTTIPTSLDNVQDAISALDSARNYETLRHQDSMHANGFDNWANSLDYNPHAQLWPETFGDTYQALVSPVHPNKFKFTDVILSQTRMSQGDVVQVIGGPAEGLYTIDDVGPRTTSDLVKPELASDELEVTRNITGVSQVVDGQVNIKVFGQSSVNGLKSNCAPSIFHSEALDTIICAKPNAAKVVSLGAQPQLLSGSETLLIEVGTDVGPKTVEISGLNALRPGSLSSAGTMEALVETINFLLQEDDCFPAAAYKLGDEFMLAHNWDGYIGYYISVSSDSTAATILGLDGYGAGILDLKAVPTKTAEFYIGGISHSGFKNIVYAEGVVSDNTISFSDFNPQDSGVKVGHLAHVKMHDETDDVGTYLITVVGDNYINVHKSMSGSYVEVEINYDAVPFDELKENGDSFIAEVFLDSYGRISYNPRLTFDNVVSSTRIIDISDNALSGEYTLVKTLVGDNNTLHVAYAGTYGQAVLVPSGFIGIKRVYFPSNIEYVDVEIYDELSGDATLSSVMNVSPHIDEEEILEICSVRGDGSSILSHIVDKRLFGTTGLDEIREDVVQAYVESPNSEMRSNGVIRGFDVLELNHADVAFDANSTAIIRGGTAFVGGVRCTVPTKVVVFPDPGEETWYFVCLNPSGNYVIVDESTHTLSNIIAGYAGELLVIAKFHHSGDSGAESLVGSDDLRFFINKLDNKIDLVVDATNHLIGSFNSISAAINYANSYPSGEKTVIKIVSFDESNLEISSGSSELTFEVNGQINDLTIGSNCKIRTSSINNRSSEHVAGNITVSSDVSQLEIDGLVVAGTVTLTPNAISNVTMRNVKFKNSVSVNLGVAAGIGDVSFLNCTFSDDSSGITDSSYISNLIVKDCIFNKGFVSATRNFSQSLIKVSGCSFYDMGAANMGNITIGTAFIDNCIFFGTAGPLVLQNGTISNTLFFATQLSNTTIISTGDGYDDGNLAISNCTFDSISRTGTSSFVSNVGGGYVEVKHSTVLNCNFTIANPAFICNEFSDNRCISISNIGTGDAVVKSSVFCRNKGFNVFEGTSAVMNPRLVSDNDFAGSSYAGYNIKIDYLPEPNYRPYTEIRANKFRVDEEQSAILLADGDTIVDDAAYQSPQIHIVNNSFYLRDGAILPAIGVNLFRSSQSSLYEGVKITGNDFVGVAAVSATSPARNLNFCNNFIKDCTFEVKISEGCSFTGNTLLSSSIELSGSSGVRHITVDNNSVGFNSSGSILISCEFLRNSSLSNNALDVSVASNLSSVNISNNIGNFYVDGTCNFYNVNMIGNQVLVDNSFSDAVLHNCIISGNIFLAADPSENISLTMAGSSETSTKITDNVFYASITLASTGVINNCAFSGNIFGHTSFLDIVVASSMQNSTICDNINCTIMIGEPESTAISADNIIVTNNLCGAIITNANITDGLIDKNTASYIEMDGYFTGSVSSNVITGSNTYSAVDYAMYHSGTFDGTCCSNFFKTHGVRVQEYNGVFSNNRVSDLSATVSASKMFVVSGNFGGAVSGNIGQGNIEFNGSGFQGTVIGNYFYGKLLFAITSVALKSFVGNISNNYIMSQSGSSGDIIFEPAALFGFGAINQVKFIGNTCQGKIDSTTSYTTNNILSFNRTFFWGNSSGATSDYLTIAGTTATNLTTANQLNGVIAN